jgi:hypothetical protein
MGVQSSASPTDCPCLNRWLSIVLFSNDVDALVGICSTLRMCTAMSLRPRVDLRAVEARSTNIAIRHVERWRTGARDVVAARTSAPNINRGGGQ